MARKILKVTLISARDLKDVNFLSKMEVYAVVSIDGDARTRQRTPIDRSGGTSPSWNVELRFPFDPAGALHVLLRAERALGDRDVGEVHIPLRELLVGAAGEKASAGQPQFVSYQVRKPGSAKPKGSLNISYTVIDAASNVSYPTPASSSTAAAYPPPGKAAKPNEPVTAYPAAASASATAYPYPAPAGYPSYPPPPPPQYGYGAPPPPPPAGYGYPLAGYGYAAPPQPPKKNKFGMGLGAGLLGGALGGLLIGDMVSDASDVSAYDAGYDAGFDDAGGFDF